jgi:hypothetical protein
LFIVVLGWLGARLLGERAGYLTSVQAVATLATALLAGAWADRVEHRRMMIGADLARALVLFAAVLGWLAAGDVSVAMLFGCVLVLAVGQALFRPALQAVLPALAGSTAELPAANALLDTTERIARLLGPGLVALAGAWLPLVHFITLDAASFVVSAAAVLAITVLTPPAPPAPASTLRQGLLRGFAALRADALLGFMLPATALINGTWYATFFLALPLAIEQHGVRAPGGDGLAAYGLVISSYGAANLLTTLVVGSLGLAHYPGRRIFGGNLCLGTGILLLGGAVLLLPAARMLPWLMAAAALGAIGGPLHDITMATLRQTRLAAPDMAAAVRAYIVTSQAGALAAMLAAPTIFAAIGVGAAIMLCGGVLVAVALAGFFRFGHQPAPRPPPGPRPL